MDYQQADLIFSAAKRLRDEIKRRDAIIAKAPHDFRDESPKKMQARNAAITWSGMAIEKLEFQLHTFVVQAGLCRPYEDDYYTDTVHHASAFHKYDFRRPHPLKALAAIKAAKES